MRTKVKKYLAKKKQTNFFKYKIGFLRFAKQAIHFLFQADLYP
jgi:hypothetical protein